MNAREIEQAYAAAKKLYADCGVDTEAALAALEAVPLSLQCWQGDDVGGFEHAGAALSGGGLAVTGNYPGRARTPEELRADLETALALIPGRHRVNLHSTYGEFGEYVPRDSFRPDHFRGWVDWARERGLGLDFNATLFAHPLAESGYTLSHLDPKIRRFWIEHVKRCREIGAWMGVELGTPCSHNLWIPDGSKDETVSRRLHREILRESLDEIYTTTFPRLALKDSVESKLFGIGLESFVVGSHEFYLDWSRNQNVMMCLDMGHYHPTESVAEKISALLTFREELLIHVSRGVKWDSDHVVLYNDELLTLMQEIVRAEGLGRVHLALDFFDASINRIGAWVTGARATLKALLFALLEPTERLREREAAGDGFGRLAWLEECKALPLGAVWNEFCSRGRVPAGPEWIEAIRAGEARLRERR